MLFIYASLILVPFAQGASLLDYVDVFIGTGGHGYGCGSQLPGPQVPFGMARPGPDTINEENEWVQWAHFGGYWNYDYYVRVFSQTHMVGSGAIDYGTIGVMPGFKAPSHHDTLNYGWKLHFHNERAGVGYYSTLLSPLIGKPIHVNITALKYTSVYNFEYPTPKSTVIIHSSHVLQPNGARASHVSVLPDGYSVEGYVLNAGGMSARFGGVYVYFAARVVAEGNEVPSFGTWNTSGVFPGVAAADGNNTGAYFEFTRTPSLRLCVAVSFISTAEAWGNMGEVQNCTMQFVDVYAQNLEMWQEMTQNIIINTPGDTNTTVKFATSVYRSLMAPTNFVEASGRYSGFDKQPHTLKSGMSAYYTDMSIWDVHRTQIPLLSWLYPSVMSDVVNSLLAMKEQGCCLPKWPFANGYTGSMIGTHSQLMIADAFFKNITSFNVSEAFAAMWSVSTQPQKEAGRNDVESWNTIGYIPFESAKNGACLSLAYAYDDWAVAQVALALGKTVEYEHLMNTSANWKNVFNPTHKFFCPRTKSGEWKCPDTWIYPFSEEYTEGDAWHYRFNVQHDIPGLMSAFGGRGPFVDELNKFLNYSEDDMSNFLPNPYYWAGNEEDLMSPFYFNYAGRPDLTQKYVRWILEKRYTTESRGLPGNDDYGTMSAWFVFASLGLYPITGSPQYFITSPSMPEVTLHRAAPGGQVGVHIKANNLTESNVYIARLEVNGMEYKSPFISHSAFNSDCMLEFWLQDTPSAWFTE